MTATRRVRTNAGSTASDDRPPAEYDVSIVLNLHDEARYLRRTLRSLEEAVEYARQFDIGFELVVVIDNGDAATTRLVESWDYGVFDAHRIVHVSNGAPGLSRNDGIAAAHGEYITTIDGDDLVGFDFLQKMYMTASSVGSRSVIFPEYFVAFGSNAYVWKFFGTDIIGKAVFFDSHPYGASIMCHADLFASVSNTEISLATGYAHEDWHFNCNCLANGCQVEIAKGAMVFYRQRLKSMRRRFHSETSGVIPPSRYFEPDTYLKLTWGDLSFQSELSADGPAFTGAMFIDRPGVSDVVAAVNRIDPAVSLGILKYRPAGSNYAIPGPAARAYFEACSLLAGERFTDVLLVPFMAKGGAEKYILSVIEALGDAEGDIRLLVIGAQPFENHGWIDKLPAGSMFIDLWSFAIPDMSIDAAEIVTLRLLQHVPGLRRLHMKNCEIVDSLLRKFSRFLGHLDTTYYYFCDPQVSIAGNSFVNGQCFDLVAEVGKDLTRVVSDHAHNLGLLDDLVGNEHVAPTFTLYNVCELPRARTVGSPRRRLLWASRLDHQKRPHLMRLIAERLAEEQIDATIDAYGGTTYGMIGPEVFDGSAGMSYRGDYDGFDQLPVADYDAFVYTAAFDGLPNVVLEAMAAGLPVIAPAVGGIGEAVDGETGYLVHDDPDDAVLVDRFVEAVKSVYADWPEAKRRARNARALIAERHSAEAFADRVRRIFLTGETNERDGDADVSPAPERSLVAMGARD